MTPTLSTLLGRTWPNLFWRVVFTCDKVRVIVRVVRALITWLKSGSTLYAFDFSSDSILLVNHAALNNLANVLNYILLHRYFTFKKSCQILVNKGERKLPWKRFRQFGYTSRGCPEFTFSKKWGICQVIIKREETLTSVYPSPLSSNAWSRKVKMPLHWVYDTLNTQKTPKQYYQDL